MGSAIQTISSNITRRETTIVTDDMIDTTVNIHRNPITTPRNMMDKTSIGAMGSTSAGILNRISTATTNRVSISMISNTSTDISATTTSSTTTTTVTGSTSTTTVTGSTKTTTTTTSQGLYYTESILHRGGGNRRCS